jgi:hypothetical protein
MRTVALSAAVVAAVCLAGCDRPRPPYPLMSETADETEPPEDGTFDPGSGIGCLFGDHLVTMARMRDLDVGAEIVIDSESAAELASIQRDQILDGFSRTGVEPPASISDALAATDDSEILLREVTDTAHERQFNMYVFSAGDNIVGFIYYARSLRLAAEIGDGSIGNCETGYSAFDSLPFFYTN